MQIILDGQQVTAKPGETIVELARRHGVFIPTLCHDPALEPAAMCRVCTVELTERGRTRLVTACNFPLRSEVEINTDTQRLRQGRKVAIELLYARCPGSKKLEELGARYGADFTRFEPDDKQCIMCGLCARVCEKVGANVLSLSGRGVEIHVDTAFGRVATHCIGCGACAQICPVDKIQIKDEGGQRMVIVCGKQASQIKLPVCTSCNKPFGPVIELDKVMARAGEANVPVANPAVCPTCCRRNLAIRMARRHLEQYDIDASEQV